MATSAVNNMQSEARKDLLLSYLGQEIKMVR
ncbi:hypothetical protein COLO4_28586 [Corchorus olitorius]|uniref:Uncharacterized protein n=1 Tax=Corchorus olitorius TaxID=93759 RepID=A0A1R3HJE2_9ROSI|nr:hypothetical protein COLO4_28586 [Corchorus olitorius]